MSDKITLCKILDRVTEHLLAQGQRAANALRACLYRAPSPDGSVLKCAVGCLILDECYDSRFEHVGLASVTHRDGRWVSTDASAGRAVLFAAALNGSGVPATEEVHRLLQRLQCVHDMYDPEDWPCKLARVRTSFEDGTL